MPPSSALFLSSLLPTPSHSPLRRRRRRRSSSAHAFSADHPCPSGDHLVKAPTAPWMTAPLLLPAHRLSKPTRTEANPDDADRRADLSLTAKVSGGRGRKAMRDIINGLTKLRRSPPFDPETTEISVDFAARLQEAMVAAGDEEGQKAKGTPWATAEGRKLVFPREKKERVVTAAERVLPEPLLARLRSEARGMKKWVRAKKAGVTDEVVEEIRRTWRSSELAMVKIVEPLRRNMDRAHEIVETKTGGLVVWRKKDVLVVYRGGNCQVNWNLSLPFGKEPSSFKHDSEMFEAYSAISLVTFDGNQNGSAVRNHVEIRNSQAASLDLELLQDVDAVKGTLYEREADRLLDELGPRFIDWWWKKPLPVDADLLPEVVPGFKTPYRRCPPGMRSQLTDDELTYLRKLARPLPTHFALGKNTKLQGLAAAIIKLWEKSPIVKIAVKVGIVNTNNEQMSWELKRLTGGVLILRNKFFIILYRGKDFLPRKVANFISERETKLHEQQLQEEKARSEVLKAFHAFSQTEFRTSTVGTLTEFQRILANYSVANDDLSEGKVKIEAEIFKLERELKQQERKLLILKLKIEKSESVLVKLNNSWGPSMEAADQELLTEEERQTFQKIGLKMDKFLLLGRRGIYDGVIGSIHQHWKHREVVKVITMQNASPHLTYTARLLEVESGGVLVALEKLRKGYAIILYRGKNYSRPLQLTPDNLLTKREALQRSLEIQRRGSLKFFAYQRKQTISMLKQRLRYLEEKSKELSTHRSPTT